MCKNCRTTGLKQSATPSGFCSPAKKRKKSATRHSFCPLYRSFETPIDHHAKITPRATAYSLSTRSTTVTISINNSRQNNHTAHRRTTHSLESPKLATYTQQRHIRTEQGHTGTKSSLYDVIPDLTRSTSAIQSDGGAASA